MQDPKPECRNSCNTRPDHTFKVKDDRVEGPGRYTSMTLATPEFICRCLIHVLPKGLHRIRHYGLLAGPARGGTLDRMREPLAVPAPATARAETQASDRPEQPCPCCGGRMRIIEVLERGCAPRYHPWAPAVIRIDTS
jgi:hypothetical protein